MKAWRNIKKFFWRPSAIIGIIWGIYSAIGVALWASEGGRFLSLSNKIILFPAWFIGIPFWNSSIPDILHNIFYKTFHIPNIPQLTYGLLSIFIAMIICVSIDHLISKLIRKMGIR